jgi:polyphosphate kinase
MNMIAHHALNPLLEALSKSLNVRSAQALIRFRADKKTQRRVEQLADKNTEGELSPEERAEYEGYVFANNFIAILQAKARARLMRRKLR